MNLNEFTVVLPSNSSMNYFPDNTTTSFSTRLSREIELYGQWLVGLSEIHVPCTTLHVRREDAILSVNEAGEKFSFQHGNFESVYTLIEAINEGLFTYYGKEVHEKLFYDEKGGYVSKRVYKQPNDAAEKKATKLSDTIKRILGFDILKKDEKFVGKRNFIITAKEPASLSRAVPDQLFVYSNICEPCIVGDTHAPLLKIVNIEANQFNYGSTIVKRFAPVTYIPLLTNRFQTIDIDIRDQFGNPIAFQFGTLTAQLHFKRDF